MCLTEKGSRTGQHRGNYLFGRRINEHVWFHWMVRPQTSMCKQLHNDASGRANNVTHRFTWMVMRLRIVQKRTRVKSAAV